MATGQAQAPNATGQTQANSQGVVTAVPVVPRVKVTYIFKATTSSSLKIPYAVAVDGAVQAAFASQNGRVSGNDGSIVVMVDQGQTVSLYLNSDAHPSYRTNRVYEVTAGVRNAEVKIREKTGRHTDTDTPVRVTDANPQVEAAKTKDEYKAPLTGDIWMKVSHKYAVSEVDALLPAGTSAAVTAAVRSIYGGLSAASLTITEPAQNGTLAKTLAVSFDDSDNPNDNITSYALLSDGLTRVHPGGYAALFSSALENEVASLKLSSCWRPMLGSIAHRAGLGLDVNYVGATRMNRQELRVGSPDTTNVSDEEIRLFREYESAIVARKQADTAATAAANAAKAAANNPTLSPEAKAQAQANKVSAGAAQEVAVNAEADAKAAWNSERDANEPSKVRLFRASLLRCSCVAQLFDPWLMEVNTKDAVPPEPNMQRGDSTSNERLHSHHLHVTVYEPRIL